MIPMLCSMFNIVFKIQKIGKTKLNLYRGMQPGGVETLIKILLGYPLMIFIKSEEKKGKGDLTSGETLLYGSSPRGLSFYTAGFLDEKGTFSFENFFSGHCMSVLDVELFH